MKPLRLFCSCGNRKHSIKIIEAAHDLNPNEKTGVTITVTVDNIVRAVRLNAANKKILLNWLNGIAPTSSQFIYGDDTE
jgi:hypothetical protein